MHPRHPRRPLRPVLAGATALASLALLGSLAPREPRPRAKDGSPEAGETFFEARVLPVLQRRCFECHGPDLGRPKGRLRLDREGLLAGGAFGPVIVPGDPDASPLVQAVRYGDEELAMPPEERLPDEEIAVLERWVSEGGEWPAGVEARRPEPRAGTPAPERAAPGAAADGEPFPREHLRFFEERVRPLLAESCFDCHGPEVEHPKGGLRMTGRAAFVRGGDSGPALVPGDPEASLLVHAVRYTDSERKMPPPGKLPPEAIADLERWVALGAPWPGDDAAEPVATTDEGGIDLEAGRRRWAFRPVERPPVPEVGRADLVRHPIDAFVLARLGEAGLAPNGPATPRERLRRLHYVLVGLPPTLEEVESFEHDPSPAAWRARVDDLLAREAYGERWARHWLDVVRFAQTNGYERDEEKPYAWRYRDWVVDALNADQPYDEFLTFQLAGDELDEVTRDSLVATGFYRIGSWDDEPADPVQAEFDELDDNLRAITEGFLGLTVGCARCHDHKFDPFPQEDYYSMLAFLRSLERYEEPVFAPDSATLTALDGSEAGFGRWRQAARERAEELREGRRQLVAQGRRELVVRRLERLPAEVREAFDTPAAERTATQQRLLREIPALYPNEARVRESYRPALRQRDVELMRELEELESSFAGDLEWALTARDLGPEPVSTHLLRRGRASSPGQEVEPRFLRVLCEDDGAAEPAPVRPRGERSTGRRRALAEWIARADHPLTARVIVNRVWHHHFGRGLVATPNDFGSTGVPPTHPELLDWLASEFVAHGWSLKWLHRQIVSSYVWNLSSRSANAEALARDPANELLWRQNPRRLDAEALRDGVLQVSGTLNPERGGRGFFPELSREALAGMSRPGEGWGVSAEEERARRALYVYAKRGLPVPLLAAFDAPTASLPVGARPTTTAATQALALLNSDFVNRQACHLARRVRSEAGDDPRRQVERAVERVLGRRARPEETERLAEHLVRQTAAFAEAPARLAFRPEVPPRVALGFLEQLAGRHVLYGPRDGWSYAKGAWGDAYNRTLARDPERSAAALLDRPAFAAGRVEARLAFEADCERVALLAGARVEDDVAYGTELVLLPRDGRAVLRRLEGARAEPEELGVAGVGLAPDRWHSLTLEVGSGRARAHLDGELLLDVAAPPPAGARFGVRVSGGTVTFDRLVLEPAGGRAVHVGPDDPGPPAQRALESVCLILLNLNEFLYVD